MATKILLTTEQHEKLMNHLVSEMVTNTNELINENGTINESVWEKVKYGLSKLGRYKANGKIFGKGKIDKEAGAKIQAIIDKEGNELIKNLNASIKETNPEFPNNEKGDQFLNTIMEIAAVYDSVIDGAKKGTIPADAANGIINDLRDYVKKFLDIDLKAAYSVVDEIQGNTLELTEEEAMSLDEAWGLDEEDGPSGIRKKPNPEDIYAKGEPEDISKPIDLNPNDTRPVKANSQVATTNQNTGVANTNQNTGVATTNQNTGVANTNQNTGVATTNQNTGVANTNNSNIIDKGTGKASTRNKDITDIDYEDIPNNQASNGGAASSAGGIGNGAAASSAGGGAAGGGKQGLNAKDVRAGLQAKRGAGDDFASTRMNTLKSNKLPMTLAGIGASLGAFSWLVNTDWFKHLFDVVSKNPSIEMVNKQVASNSDIIGNIKPGQGLTQLMNAMNHAGITPKTTPEQFLEQVKILGGGDVNAGINALAAKGGIFVNPDAAKSVLTDIAKNPHGHGDTLGQIFKGKWAGTGKSVGDMLTCKDMGQVKGLISTTITKAVPTLVMKTAIKTGAGYAAAKGLGAILGPIGLAAVGTGALVKIMRMKGQKQSRAKTLNDLYQSLRNIDGGVGLVEPETETVSVDAVSNPQELSNIASSDNGGDKGGDKGANVANADTQKGGDNKMSQVNDDLYNSIKNLFKFVVNNRKNLGVRSANNVGTANADKLVKGQKVSWTKKDGSNTTGTIVGPSQNPNETIVKTQNGNQISIKTIKLTPSTSLNEGKYIKDKRLIQFLQKSLSYDKLKSFEDFMNRVEIIRNKIKKIDPMGDKAIQNFMSEYSSNPIMSTDFQKLFSIDPNNPQAVNALKAFIDDIFITVYSGKFKYGNMIDKMAGIGGSINSLEEEAGYNFKEPNKSFKKDAQNRGSFKNNLVKFLSTTINLFQYMNKLKDSGKLNSGKKTSNSGSQKPQAQPQQNKEPQAQQNKEPQAQQNKEPQQVQQAKPAGQANPNRNPEKSEISNDIEWMEENKSVKENIERIKKIMFS